MRRYPELRVSNFSTVIYDFRPTTNLFSRKLPTRRIWHTSLLIHQSPRIFYIKLCMLHFPASLKILKTAIFPQQIPFPSFHLSINKVSSRGKRTSARTLR